ncbi:MAG: hypothetical protein KBD01_18265 [Acidobacteria bacterium]|nr:hypothetical protein [Acidobacteriota bacterium]
MLRQRFTYFEGSCAVHGTVRAALTESAPVLSHPCPSCGRPVGLLPLGCTGTVGIVPRLVPDHGFNPRGLASRLPLPLYRVTPTTRDEYRIWIQRLRDEMGDDL